MQLTINSQDSSFLNKIKNDSLSKNYFHQILGRENNCESCLLSPLCLPNDLEPEERRSFTSLISCHKRLKAGETLYYVGDPFENLNFIKTGSFKTIVLMDDGREQVTGFHFAGNILGIDAITTDSHKSQSIALEDSVICSISYSQLEHLSKTVDCLQTYLNKLLAKEVVRNQGLMLLLGRMHAEERVIAFLRDMSKRFHARGLSSVEFNLPMSREEIGNYLGLTLETVSRCFSKLKKTGLIMVSNRNIRLLSKTLILPPSIPEHEVMV
jgi:CRP/FNR family transcriptional regulator